MDNSEIKSLLQSLGERVPPGLQLILIGGGALELLGSPRLTIDIDFIVDDVNPSEFHRSIMQIARDLQVDVHPVGPVPCTRRALPRESQRPAYI